MSYKSIVAVASGGADDARLMAAVAGLTARFGARAEVLPAFADPAAGFLSYGASLGRGRASVLAERLAASERGMHDKLESVVREAAQRAGAASDGFRVEQRELSPAAALTRSAALADLVVFSADAVGREGLLRGLFAEALIEMRAPILLVKGDILPLGAAAIAWDGSTQAGRAVREAAALLALAERVVVLTNVEDEALDQKAAAAAGLRAYLEARGVSNVGVHPVKGHDIAVSILAGAREEKCAMLVSGAYGRPRLQELVLGGSTRAMVNAEGPPSLFMAH